MRVKTGVILAAGRGSRIFPLSIYFPKPLLPICNKPVMEYQIETMARAGIKNVVIVLNEQGDQIKKNVGDGRKYGVRINYVVDKNPQGIASSLMSAKSKIPGPFALFLGDIFMPRMDISSGVLAFEKLGIDGVIFAKNEKDKEAVRRNFEIVADSLGKVLKVVEKPKRPSSLLKGLGFYIFSPRIFEAIAKTPKTELRGEFEITDSIQTLIEMDGQLMCEEWDLWDFNLSYPEDLLMCNLKMLAERGIDLLIGEGAKVGNDARIKRSVIGDRAEVLSPVTMEECLVLPETKVKKNLQLMRRQIFVNDRILTI